MLLPDSKRKHFTRLIAMGLLSLLRIWFAAHMIGFSRAEIDCGHSDCAQDFYETGQIRARDISFQPGDMAPVGTRWFRDVQLCHEALAA
jgi:hypothetical protein